MLPGISKVDVSQVSGLIHKRVPLKFCTGFDSDNKGYLTSEEAGQFLDNVRAATDLGGRRVQKIRSFDRGLGQICFFLR